METGEFQRARSPEQQQLRRAAILAAAREMLDRSPLAEVSLRELSRRVGLSKSNVVRYFSTREAVFLVVLVEDWHGWLADLEPELPAADRGRRPQEQNELVAGAVARTLRSHPRFCELLASCAAVLEHNVPESTAREFKTAARQNLMRLAELIVAAIPDLDPQSAYQFAAITWAFTTGAWPMATPSPSVAKVLQAPDLADLAVDFVPAVTRALSLVLDGLTRPQ